MSEKIIRKHACVRGSEFEDLDLSGSRFENVNLDGSTFHNVNFSDVSISAADFSNVDFRHIGPPRDASGEHPRQAPVSFQEADFNGSIFDRVDLSNVRISNCKLDGMSIDGIPVKDMIQAYRELQ